MPMPSAANETAGARQARSVANNFLGRALSRPRLGATPSRNPLPSAVGDCSATFWWDDQTPLYEFPFLGGDRAGSRGYVLVSASRNLPPVHEYAFTGDPVSVQLNRFLSRALA